MRDKPDASDLLNTARRVLTEDLLPELPRDKRYAALMVAAAMATAAREAEAGDGPLIAEREALATLYETDGTLDDLNRRFAADLRAGRFDDDPDEAVEILRRSVLHRLAESNPRYLD